MNHKFSFKICSKQMVDMDWLRFNLVKNHLPDGDYEIIVRKQISWDTDPIRWSVWT